MCPAKLLAGMSSNVDMHSSETLASTPILTMFARIILLVYFSMSSHRNVKLFSDLNNLRRYGEITEPQIKPPISEGKLNLIKQTTLHLLHSALDEVSQVFVLLQILIS